MTHGGKRPKAGRPRGQGRYGTTTKAIRVPEYLADEVIDFALNRGYKIPLLRANIRVGSPSLVADHIEDTVDMNSLLIKNPETTFCMRAEGLSMSDARIYDGDILLVDSSITPVDGKMVVASIDSALTVKPLSYIDGKPYLLPENPSLDPIPVLENPELHIWGVVTNVLKSL
ncbi:MAG: DNA polymerase V [Rickettsiales bacterium]|nr:MAG: DNA polymerase V [Rickettsiales bacterium]